MKIKYIIVGFIGFLTYFAIHYVILSYGNVQAHTSINGAIVEKFNETMNHTATRPKKFDKYEFSFEWDADLFKGMAVTNLGLFDASYGESEQSKTLKDWIKHGGLSADEPEVAASVRHFYDPLGLSGGNKYLTNRSTWWEGGYTNPHTDAIEWALGDTPNGASNKWSLKEGKKYLINALQTKDTNERKLLLAKAFRCLGEVLHNTGDMGCPAHVRNDSHPSPIGYTLGFAMGSPDPYEELLVKSNDIPGLDNSTNPDADLASSFEDATNIRSIDENLAKFTNSNFFTNETINGFVDDIYLKSPINSDGNYPSPRLENITYNPESYSFVRQFPSGREVILCKDHSYFKLNGRGYPYIDKAAVMSQAQELIPDIISAGVNVMRLFIPYVRIELTDTDDLSDTIQIKVIHELDEEYTTSIKYSGKINFKLNGKIHDSILVIEKGEFKGVLPFPIKNGDKLEAFIDLSSFIINCDKEVIVKMDPLWGQWYMKEILNASNDPAAPKSGTVFTGIKFFTVLKNGMVKITNLDGTGLQQFNYSRNSLSFTISGASSTQSYTQTGNVDGSQDTWSAQTKSTYKQGSTEYYRQYNSQGSRQPIPEIKISILNRQKPTKDKTSYDIKF